ncbi:MAG TPA: alternative oxidase [Candidatus Paceibacterota bacterium]|nr:alternative oxidase [Candidatus Paceibacterota bacterium]
MNEDFASHEDLVRELNDPLLRHDYARPYDNYRPGIVPLILGYVLVTFGNLVYGFRPSYGKFKAIEVIARIPYQSWEVAAYTLLSAFHGNEAHAMKLTRMAAFSRAAQDNETMHVVVISHLAKQEKQTGFFRHTLIPLLFALVYFWLIYLLYIVSHRASLELNYVFEKHAYAQYERFLKENEEALKRKPCVSDFLSFYGRDVRSQYEFFESVRNDELIHRNRSIREIESARKWFSAHP